ncbi:hypothetical protein K440DRAFT_623240 [Wilcoxina mikolae CBS 423.85]|nr:hypothetical protein K440DRAFT_623240 [Wilcoxina mikolae CBS 423.85]
MHLSDTWIMIFRPRTKSGSTPPRVIALHHQSNQPHTHIYSELHIYASSLPGSL